MTDVADRKVLTSWLGAAEAALSIVSVCLVGALPLHYLGSHLCAFGECSEPGPDEVRTYWILVAALTLALVGTFVVASCRRARGAFLWHVVVALTGVIAMGAFAMPSTGTDREIPPDEPRDAPSSYHPPCHSGPPNDCVGG